MLLVAAVTRPRATRSSNSGMRSLEMAIDAEILITAAVTQFSGGTSRLMYALRTELAMAEKHRTPGELVSRESNRI